MHSNIRRMALDVAPLVAFGLAVNTFASAAIDLIWLSKIGATPVLFPGLLCILGMLGCVAKTPVWQTLPVSRADIGRARWWQAIGGPILLVAAALFLPAAILAGLGRLRVDWADIGFVFSGQFAVLAITVFLITALAAAIRKWGRWAGILLIPLLFMGRFIFPIGVLTSRMQLLLAVGGAVAAAGSAAFYLLAGHWEPTATITPWSAPKAGPSPEPKTPSPSLRGWPALLWMIAPGFGAAWLLMLPVALIAKSLSGGVLAASISFFFAALPVMIHGNQGALIIRLLRGLPLDGYALTLRLFLFQLVVQAISLAILSATFLLLHMPPPRPLLAATLLVMPSFLFPFVLRFDSRIVVVGTGGFIGGFTALSGIAARGQAIFHIPTAAILACALAVLAMGFAWSHWEIAHGANAYRMRPSGVSRWRGRG